MSCTKCGGQGFIESFKKLPDGELAPTIYRDPCECLLYKQLDEQADRTWQGLSRVPVEDNRGMFKEYLKQSLYLTSDLKSLALTLRGALWAKGNPNFISKVVDENMLMSVWLSGMHEEGKKVIDPDFDYSVPARDILGFNGPDLLIIRLGIKNSRNIATPEVLVDVLENRRGLFKPTWVVDSQDKPFRMGHISWSTDGERILKDFEHIDLTSVLPTAVVNTTPSLSLPKKPTSSGIQKTGTRATFNLK